MIAIDTSSWVAYLSGDQGRDVEEVDAALALKQVVLPPVVLSELLSNAKLPKTYIALLKEIPLLSVQEGYWERSGILRAKVLTKGHKARLADTLIAQSCIDHATLL